MKLVKYLFMALLIMLPINSFAGSAPAFIGSHDTDTLVSSAYEQITAYYDLRDRSTYLQITNDSLSELTPANTIIHVQIFQHDRDCSELDFFDELTPNDTVVYDLDNIVKNNGEDVPINLLEDSYGYVVVTATLASDTDMRDTTRQLIGNSRIVDNDGYEYRTNMPNTGSAAIRGLSDFLIANFNNIDGANQADVIGYGYVDNTATSSSVSNLDRGLNFDIFIFDLDEEPLSCDNKNFACGTVMNYGINDDYESSRDNPPLCAGGGLSDPKGGFISFENATDNFTAPPDFPFTPTTHQFLGFIGINNGDGTGSMDMWIIVPGRGSS